MLLQIGFAIIVVCYQNTSDCLRGKGFLKDEEAGKVRGREIKEVVNGIISSNKDKTQFRFDRGATLLRFLFTNLERLSWLVDIGQLNIESILVVRVESLRVDSDE